MLNNLIKLLTALLVFVLLLTGVWFLTPLGQYGQASRQAQQEADKRHQVESHLAKLQQMLELYAILPESDPKISKGYPQDIASLLSRFEELAGSHKDTAIAQHFSQWQAYLKTITNPYTQQSGPAATYANWSDDRDGGGKQLIYGSVLYQPFDCNPQTRLCKNYKLHIRYTDGQALARTGNWELYKDTLEKP